MKEYIDDMIKDLAKLISIKSVRSKAVEGAPYGQNTLNALETVLDMGKAYGLKTKNIDGRAGYIEYGEGEAMIGILLHLDVVPEGDGWVTDPYTLTEKDGYLYGRGTADDKGPAIAALYALFDLIKKDEIEGYRVRLIFGLDEECGSSCIEHYVKTEELPTLGFVPDADFPLIYAEKGILNVVLGSEGSDAVSLKAGERPNVVPGKCYITYRGEQKVYEGVPAHGAAPYAGVNAIKTAVMNSQVIKGLPIITFFENCLMDKHYGEGLGIDPKDESGRLTVNPGIMAIEKDQSYVVLNIRYPVTCDHKQIVDSINKAADKYGIVVTNVSDNPPLYVDKGSILVSTLLKVYREITGDMTEPLAIGGGTYARSMPNLVAYGMNMPGDPDCAHQANEYIKKQRLYESAAIYREGIKRLGMAAVSQTKRCR
jgi:succinyl-diaminopimelate desuccinylase